MGTAFLTGKGGTSGSGGTGYTGSQGYTGSAGGAGVTAVDDLTDVVISSSVDHQTLIKSGSNWINGNPLYVNEAAPTVKWNGMVWVDLSTNNGASEPIDYDNAYFVAKTGNDSTGTGSESNPWLTINYAMNHANVVAGKTVYVRSGTYNERVVITKSGTFANPITLKNYPSENVVIDGTNIDFGEGVARFNIALIDLSGSEYITVDGFEIANAGGVGIGCPFYHDPYTYRGTVGVTIQNCYVHDTIGSGITVAFATYANIYNNILDYICQCTDASSGEALSIAYSNFYEVHYNTLTNSGFDTADILPFPAQQNWTWHREGIDAKLGSNHGKIHHNRIKSNAWNSAIYIDAGSQAQFDIEVYENTIYNSHTGIALGVESSGGKLYDINVHHNYIYDCHGEGITFMDFGANRTMENIKINNNKMMGMYMDQSTGGSLYAGVYIGSATQKSNMEIKENLISGNSWVIPIRNGYTENTADITSWDVNYNTINQSSGNWYIGSNARIIGLET